MLRLILAVVPVVAGFVVSAACGGQSSVVYDCRDLPRGLLHAEQTIDASALAIRDGVAVLRYPQWVPGSHAPGGPVQNVAGLWFKDGAGNELTWRRTPGDVYRFEVFVPEGLDELVVRFRYIANQPTANSRGLDTFGSADMALVSPNTALLYPEHLRDDEFEVAASLVLPEGWSAACALDVVEEDGARIEYDAVTIRRLVDTPILMGLHHREYSLNEDGVDAPRHTLHVISERAEAAEIPDETVEAYTAMVTQSAKMFGSFPFESMDILLGVTDQLPRNGLEHLRSTMNILPTASFETFEALRGWDQMLIPHEYVHAWCGKYRRPAGMATDDFHTPKGTELLWVYEGLTTYLAEVLENRAGLFEDGEYLWAVRGGLRRGFLQQGRDWRPLIDTCAASHTLRGGSANWGHLRRSQDYYGEGALIWMEADAIIRTGTDGAKSLDDFCRLFFASDGWTDEPSTFTHEDVLADLGEVYEHDWAGFFEQRLSGTGGKGPVLLAKKLGYALQFVNEPPRGKAGAHDPLDARESVGMSVSRTGTVRTVMLNSPADAAGLGPGDRIMGVGTEDGSYTWSTARYLEALEDSVSTGGVELLVVSGDTIERVRLDYDQGPRFLDLVRTDEGNTVFDAILAPVE